MSFGYSRQVTQIGLPEEAAPFMAQRDRELDVYLAKTPRLLARAFQFPSSGTSKSTTSTTLQEVSSLFRVKFIMPMSGEVTVVQHFLTQNEVYLGVMPVGGTELRAHFVTADGSTRRSNAILLVTGQNPRQEVEWTAGLRRNSSSTTVVAAAWGGNNGPGVIEVWDYPQ
jgi:hypothetical protein